MKELNLTQGSVSKKLFTFATPFLIANLLQALYGGVDLFVIGQFDDSAGVAGVAIGSQVIQTITGIILGITTGITILIGIATGAKNTREITAIIGSSIWLFILFGGTLTLLMTLLHHPIALAMQTPPEALTDTENYLLICSLGIPFIMGYNVVFGIMRGMGDSRSPLYFTALACAINIALDFLFVGGLHMRTAGAALATILSQGISFLAALRFLYRKGPLASLSRQEIRWQGFLAKRILVLGAPLALQDGLVNISFLLITIMVNQIGVIAAAALGVVEKLIVFAVLPPMAIASAVAAMTAQNYGAGLFQRMVRCLRVGIGMALLFGLSFCIYSQFAPESLISIFTHDNAVIRLASGYLRSYSLDCIVISFVFCFNAYFCGQGNSWFPLIHSLIATFLFRIPLSWILCHLDPSTLLWMGFASPFASLVSLGICLWYLRRQQTGLKTPQPLWAQS